MHQRASVTPRHRRAARARRPVGPDGSRERGIVAVEFALIAPVLILLLFGIVDFGVAFNDLSNVRQAVREGARAAAVANFGTSAGCTTTGTVDATSLGSSIICSTKNQISGPTDVRVGIWILPGHEWAQGEPVTVCAQYTVRSITGLTDRIMANRVVTARSQFRIEVPLSAGQSFTSQAESPVSTWPTTCTG